MDTCPFTESQSSAVLLTRSTRWSDVHHLESQEEPTRKRHRPNTPAGELGLDHLDAVGSYPLAQSHIPRPCLMHMMYVLEYIFN